VRLARQIADALAHAHARGVVHRDVKPENVLLRDGHVLVADFGIALAAEQDFEQAPGSAGGARLTRTGLLLGTPRYMAPEQATGDRAVDARADVYGLGAVLYEALAGEPPFAGPTAQAVVRRVLGEAPRPLAARAPAVPPGVEAAVMTALAKAPADRFPSAAAFAAALEAALERGSAGPLPTPAADPHATRSATHVAPPVSRRRGLPAGAVALLTAGALGTGALLGWTAHAVANRTQEIVAAPARDVVRVPGTAPADASPGVEPPAGPANDGGDGALRLVVVDRGGQVVRELPAERPWTPRFSPDGGRVAYGAFRPGGDGSELWVADLRTGAAARLTDDGRDGNDPQWSPDGRRLAYSAAADGGKDLFVRPVEGGMAGRAGGARALSPRRGDQFPTDWLPDGSGVLLTEQAGGALDVLVQSADGGTVRPYAATSARESAARASPDGRWVAYTSDEAGRDEVYVDAYPTPGRRTRVSAAGGEHPVWARDGRTLYYWQSGQLIAAAVESAPGGAPPRVRAREALFDAPYAGGVIAMYDVSPDGQRVVLVTAGGR
jgi:serine/threonine-protein kinase